MYYFFKQHEENFKEWRNSGYQGIPDAGVDFLKHLASRNFKPDLKIVKFWNEKQWKKVQLARRITIRLWKYKMITKGRAAFYNKI